MAFLRIKSRGIRRYYYIVENRRRGAKVQQKILEYLGHRPDPARLKKAMEYWQVGTKRRKPGKGGKG